MQEYQSLSDTRYDCKYHVISIPNRRKKRKRIFGVLRRRFSESQRNFTGEHFWARGYFVSTVGLDEQMVRA